MKGRNMAQREFHIVECMKCGGKNRIPNDKAESDARCGKCGARLSSDNRNASALSAYFLRCLECGTRNKIPGERIESGAKCGKCGKPLKTEEIFRPNPILATDGNFDVDILKSPLPALVFAWAPWCPTCRAAIPIVDDFARDARGKIRVAKVNVDSSPMLSSRFNILSVPTILVFDKGQLKETMPGAMQKHEIMMKMAPYLSPSPTMHK
jgi:thioredoxin 2